MEDSELPQRPKEPMPDELPPLLPATEAAPAKPPVARWRWWIHLLLLASYPIAIGVLGYVMSKGNIGSLVVAEDIVDLPSLADKLNRQPDPLSQFLRGRLSLETAERLSGFISSQSDAEGLTSSLVEEFNKVIGGGLLHATNRFSGVELSEDTLALLGESAERKSHVRLNRLLLQDAYPLEFRKSPASAAAQDDVGAALSANPRIMLQLIGEQLALFFLIFGIAWSASRVTARQLLLGWGRGFGPIWRGFLYAIGLRVLIGVLVLGVVLIGMALGGFGSSGFSEEDISDLPVLADDLGSETNAVSRFLTDGFSDENKKILAGYLAARSEPEALKTAVVTELNEVLEGELIYEEERFAGVTLSKATEAQLLKAKEGKGAVRLNRMLLQDAYPQLEGGSLDSMRPKVENTIDVKALATDPVYLLLGMTLVSFVFAGFREELWRVGVLAGLAALFPSLFSSLKGKIVAVGIVAVIFGLGHISQGMSGVLMTTVLGAGLGAIIVFHGSIWDAVLAHGFFDATTFALLYVVLRYLPEFDLGF